MDNIINIEPIRTLEAAVAELQKSPVDRRRDILMASMGSSYQKDNDQGRHAYENYSNAWSGVKGLEAKSEDQMTKENKDTLKKANDTIGAYETIMIGVSSQGPHFQSNTISEMVGEIPTEREYGNGSADQIIGIAEGIRQKEEGVTARLAQMRGGIDAALESGDLRTVAKLLMSHRDLVLDPEIAAKTVRLLEQQVKSGTSLMQVLAEPDPRWPQPWFRSGHILPQLAYTAGLEREKGRTIAEPSPIEQLLPLFGFNDGTDLQEGIEQNRDSLNIFGWKRKMIEAVTSYPAISMAGGGLKNRMEMELSRIDAGPGNKTQAARVLSTFIDKGETFGQVDDQVQEALKMQLLGMALVRVDNMQSEDIEDIANILRPILNEKITNDLSVKDIVETHLTQSKKPMLIGRLKAALA